MVHFIYKYTSIFNIEETKIENKLKMKLNKENAFIFIDKAAYNTVYS